MKRRDVLKYTAFAFGSALSSPLTNALISGSIERILNTIEFRKPKHFTPDQFQLLTVLADVILPKTDSPSASEVGVPIAIDGIIDEVLTEQDRNGFMSVFGPMHAFLLNNDFLNSGEDDQKELVSSVLNRSVDVDDAVYWGMNSVWDLTITNYLSSEKIGEEFLGYLPVPGYYDPCIDVNDVKNIRWAI